MNRRVFSYAPALVLCLAAVFRSGVAEAQSRFLTLPFNDPAVIIQNGWLYTTPGPFDCDPVPYCHRGIDYVKGELDQPPWDSFAIQAAAGGRAVASAQEAVPGYGTFVYVAHQERDPRDLRYFTIYAHLSSVMPGIPSKTVDELRRDIELGDFSTWAVVKRGEVVGMAGNTGVPTEGVHLHFEVQLGGYALNKTDPYDISDTRDFYPRCGPNFLWAECPPTPASPVVSNSGGASYFATSATFSFEVPPGHSKNFLVVTAATAQPSGAYLPTCTYAGVPLVQIRSNIQGDYKNTSIQALQDPPTGINDLVCTASLGVSSTHLGVLALYNARGIVQTTATAPASVSGVASPSITPVSPNSVIIDVISYSNSGGGVAPTIKTLSPNLSGQTLVTSEEFVSLEMGSSYYVNSDLATQTFYWLTGLVNPSSVAHQFIEITGE